MGQAEGLAGCFEAFASRKEEEREAECVASYFDVLFGLFGGLKRHQVIHKSFNLIKSHQMLHSLGCPLPDLREWLCSMLDDGLSSGHLSLACAKKC